MSETRRGDKRPGGGPDRYAAAAAVTARASARLAPRRKMVRLYVIRHAIVRSSERRGRRSTHHNPERCTMAKNRNTGEWKLINVVLNGINLGKTFRSQFAQAYKQYGGNLDKVIDHWGQAPQTGA